MYKPQTGCCFIVNKYDITITLRRLVVFLKGFIMGVKKIYFGLLLIGLFPFNTSAQADS